MGCLKLCRGVHACTETEAETDTMTDDNGFQTHFIGLVDIISSISLSGTAPNRYR